MTIHKKVFITIAVVLVLLISDIYFVFSYMDALVETAIETAGSSKLGTDARMDSVVMDLLGGSESTYGFSIYNPAGFAACRHR